MSETKEEKDNTVMQKKLSIHEKYSRRVINIMRLIKVHIEISGINDLITNYNDIYTYEDAITELGLNGFDIPLIFNKIIPAVGPTMGQRYLHIRCAKVNVSLIVTKEDEKFVDDEINSKEKELNGRLSALSGDNHTDYFTLFHLNGQFSKLLTPYRVVDDKSAMMKYLMCLSYQNDVIYQDVERKSNVYNIAYRLNSKSIKLEHMSKFYLVLFDIKSLKLTKTIREQYKLVSDTANPDVERNNQSNPNSLRSLLAVLKRRLY